MTLSDELAQINTIFIDTAPVIYYIEAHSQFGPLTKEVVSAFQSGKLNAYRQMVRRGYAWAYREYLKGPYASEYLNVEKDARAKRLGLWKQANPLPPWEFRKMLRRR